MRAGILATSAGLIPASFIKTPLGLYLSHGVLIFFATRLGGSVGPILGGYIYDRTQSYDFGWLICMSALFIVAVTILTLRSKDPKSQN